METTLIMQASSLHLDKLIRIFYNVCEKLWGSYRAWPWRL